MPTQFYRAGIPAPSKHSASVTATGSDCRSSDPRSVPAWNNPACASALCDQDVAVGMSGYGKSSLAVKLGGSGDLTSSRLWLQPKPASQRVGSGVIVGQHLYIIDENGRPRCQELSTGRDLWDQDEKFNSLTWGSLVHADGKLMILMRIAETIVLAASPKFEVLAVNSLGKGEQSNSSLAVSDGDVFVRTFRHLWCISENKK